MNAANEDFFGELFFDYLTAHITPELTSSEVDYIEQTLKLAGPSSVLDIGCGGGRHSIELARRGHRVTAIERSLHAIDRARSTAQEAGIDVNFIHGGTEQLHSLADDFDGALSWQTSLGIYPGDGGDKETLERVSGLMRPGGRFVVETTSLPWLIRNFVAQDWRQVRGAIVFERRELDLVSQTMHTESAVAIDGRVGQHLKLDLRMYTCSELVGMLECAGLTVATVEGALGGEAYSLSSRRMIITAFK